MFTFKLRFPESEIKEHAQRYLEKSCDDDEKKLEEKQPHIRQCGFLTREMLLLICRWKAPRSAGHAKKNDEQYVGETTRFALTTPNERARIEALRLLDGVDWPTASVILHFFHRDKHPILDWRALESLGVDVEEIDYTFDFWKDYVKFCRDLARHNSVDMRTLDRALWQFSQDHPSR